MKRHVITREQPLDPRLSDDSDGISWLDDLSFPSIPSSAAVDGFSIASTAAVVDEGEFAHGRGDVIDSRIAKGGGELIEEVNGCVAGPSSPTVEGGGDGSGAGDDGSGAGDDDGGGERELIVDVRSSHNPRPSQSRKSKKSRSFCSAKFPTVALGAFGSVAITLACIISFTTIVHLAGAQRTSISLLDCGNDPFTDVYEEYLVAARRTQWQIDRLQTEQPSSDFINGDLNDEDDGQDSRRSPVVDFTRDGKDHLYNDSFHDAIEPAPNWTRTSRTPFLYVRSRFLSSLGIRFIQVWQPTPILSMVLRQKGGAICVQHRITGATSSSAANTTTTSNYIVMEEDAISTMEEDLLMRELLVKEEIAMEGR
uniref:Uncharacterized protein n=1 Tax=Grammatophora oceanica TaxID=210454 RepID=A0A7S1Y5J6_9STRA